MLGFDIAKSLSIVFEEWLSREEKFSIDCVVLDTDAAHIDSLQFQCSLLVHGDIHLWFTLLGIFQVLLALISDLSVNIKYSLPNVVHLLFVVKFAIELIKLVLDSQEHHLPFFYGVSLIFLHNFPGNFVTIFCATKEIEVSLQVIVLDAKSAILCRLFHRVKKANSFLHSVL